MGWKKVWGRFKKKGKREDFRLVNVSFRRQQEMVANGDGDGDDDR